MKSLNKHIFSLFIFTLFAFGIQSVSAQTTSKADTTIPMVVPGGCAMCKEGIESTAMDVAGVIKAAWNIQTDTLVLVGSSKITKETVGAALAKAVYRSDVCASDEKAYNKLPGCCRYDSGLKKH